MYTFCPLLEPGSLKQPFDHSDVNLQRLKLLECVNSTNCPSKIILNYISTVLE